MRKLLFIIFPICLFTNFFSKAIFSQEDSPISISTDIYSRYVWRGTDFGSSPTIQPGIEFSKLGFTIGAWGAYTTNINPTAQEADIYLGYTFLNDQISITLTDYFFPTDGIDNSYFVYDNSTSHVFEASLSYNGTENLPIGILVGTLVYGDDKDGNGDNRYSTYLELSYSPEIKEMPISIFCGLNLLATSESDLNLANPINGFYGDKLGVVNLGISATNNIKITDSFSLPLNLSVITNPMSGNFFIVAGFSF
jgi:hypothetical protein